LVNKGSSEKRVCVSAEEFRVDQRVFRYFCGNLAASPCLTLRGSTAVAVLSFSSISGIRLRAAGRGVEVGTESHRDPMPIPFAIWDILLDPMVDCRISHLMAWDLMGSRRLVLWIMGIDEKYFLVQCRERSVWPSRTESGNSGDRNR